MIDDATHRSRTTHITILFCFVAALCEGFDIQAAGVAAAGIRHDFQPTAEQLGHFFSAGNFGLLLGALIGGRLSDRLGRKAILVGSIAAFGLFSLITSQTWSAESLTWMRAVTGMGLGGAMPNLIALAAESSTPGSRNGSIAITYIGMPIGGATVSLIASFTTIEHWRWLFLIGGGAPLLIAAAMAARMPSTRSPEAFDRLSPRESTPANAIRSMFSASRAARTLLLWLGFFLMQLTLQVMLNWLPLLLQARGLTKSAAAVAQVGFNVGGAAGALLIGVLLDRRARLSSIATTAIALPSLLFVLATTPERSTWLLVLPLFLGGGILAFQVILYGVADKVYPPSARGAGLGTAVGVGRLGAIVGPVFAAYLLTAGRTPTQVLTGVLPLVIVCGMCVAILGWRAFRLARLESA